MIEWIATISPAVVISVIFYFVGNRVFKKLDEKVSQGVCKVMHAGLEKELKEMKKSADPVMELSEKS